MGNRVSDPRGCPGSSFASRGCRTTHRSARIRERRPATTDLRSTDLPAPDSRHRILSTRPSGRDAWNRLPSPARPRRRSQQSRGPRPRGPAALLRGRGAPRNPVIPAPSGRRRRDRNGRVDGCRRGCRQPRTPARTADPCRLGSEPVSRVAGLPGRTAPRPTLSAPQAAGHPKPGRFGATRFPPAGDGLSGPGVR